MKPMLPAAAAHEYHRQREALLQAFPELADDEIALRDTLDGISYAPDLVALFVRDALEDESLAEALALRIKAMNERKTRLLSRGDRRRLAAQNLMQACDIRKVELPDFTASIRAVPPSLIIDDQKLLPEEVCVTTLIPSRTLIKEALSKGPVDGAHMSNGGVTLTIRTK